MKKTIVNENITTVEGLIKLPSVKILLQYKLQHVNVVGEPKFIMNYAKECSELNMLLKQTMVELRKNNF